MIKLKTVREVAKELNISRQAVYSKLTDRFKEEFTTIEKIKNRDTLVVTDEGVEELRKDMDNLDSQSDSQDNSQVDNTYDSKLIELMAKNIEILQNQLEVKDQQIVELNQRLKEAQDLNKNSQILLHREQDQTKLLESKGVFSFKKWFGKDKENNT